MQLTSGLSDPGQREMASTTFLTHLYANLKQYFIYALEADEFQKVAM